MSRIYHAQSISVSNDTYVFEIWDSPTPAAPDASVQLVCVDAQLNYDQPENQGFKDKAPFGLMPSDCTVKFAAMKTSDMVWSATVQNFFEALASDEEQKWTLKITKNGSFWWVGRIICDQIRFQWSDQYTFVCEIAARDAINLLEGYYVDSTMFSISSTRESGIVMIRNLINKAGLLGYFDSSVFADAIKTTNASFAGTNIGKTLAFTTFHILSFVENYDLIQPTERIKYLDCKTALNNILEIFGARMFLSNGMFWITQANQYDSSSISYTTYDSSGALIVAGYNSTLSHRVTMDTAHPPVRPKWQFEPMIGYQKPIRRIELQWDERNAEIFERTSASSALYSNTTTNLLTGTVPGYNINLKAKITFDRDPLSWYKYKVRWYIHQLSGGTYYIWNGTTWTSYGASPLYAVSEDVNIDMTSVSQDWVLDVTIPEIGTGSLAFGFEVKKVIDPVAYSAATGLIWTGSTSSTSINFTHITAISQSYTTGSATFEYHKKYGININSPRNTNSTLLEFPQVYYDATSAKDIGGLMVWNGSSYVYPGNWSASWHSETGIITAVLAANITGLYTNYLKYIDGTWHDSGTFHPAKTLYFDSVNWIFNGGKFEFKSDTWDGNWIAISQDYTKYTSDGTGVRTVIKKDDEIRRRLENAEKIGNDLRAIVGKIGQAALIPQIISDSSVTADPGVNKTYFVQLVYSYSALTPEFTWELTEGGAGGANLGYTASPTNGIVTSDSGSDATLTLADATNAGLLKPADFTQLASLATTYAPILRTYLQTTTTIPTGSFIIQAGSWEMASTNILTIQGTGKLTIID